MGGPGAVLSGAVPTESDGGSCPNSVTLIGSWSPQEGRPCLLLRTGRHLQHLPEQLGAILREEVTLRSYAGGSSEPPQFECEC